MKDRKKPLYRKVNTKARYHHHHTGPDYRHTRNTKAEKASDLKRGSMKTVQRGLDYTPLFRFLLSKVGQDWDVVHSEAVSRLDKPDPIFWMVAIHEDDKEAQVGCGENASFNGLYVDEENKLQKVDPDIKPEDLEPGCRCCTHTFNGKPYTKESKWRFPSA